MHDFLKACQYATFDEKVSLGLQLSSIKKLGQGSIEWTNVFLILGLQPWKLNTLMKTRFTSKMAMF